MRPLAYNFSFILKSSIAQIEALRKDILLTPLSPKQELQLRWDARVSQIYHSLSLTDNPVSKTDIIKTLTSQSLITASFSMRNMAKRQRIVMRFKKSLDYISHDWLVSPKFVTPKTIHTLEELADEEVSLTDVQLKQFLDYIQTNPEHPLLLAGISYVYFQNSYYLKTFISYLFLYKAGYDFRGLLVLEEYFKDDRQDYNQNIKSALKNETITLWLEYYLKAMTSQLQKSKDILTSSSGKSVQNSGLTNTFLELNDRQKSILSLLDNPTATVTNQKVQKIFKVSPITASRDLSRMVVLGVIIPRGKGRSIYYSKV